MSIRLTCGRSQVQVLYRPPDKSPVTATVTGLLICCRAAVSLVFSLIGIKPGSPFPFCPRWLAASRRSHSTNSLPAPSLRRLLKNFSKNSQNHKTCGAVPVSIYQKAGHREGYEIFDGPFTQADNRIRVETALTDAEPLSCDLVLHQPSGLFCRLVIGKGW